MLERLSRDAKPADANSLAAALDRSGGVGPGFNTLRLAAAIAVLLTHAFDLSQAGFTVEPVRIFSGRQASLGGLAFYCLFIISGFLVTASFTRARSISDFAWKRATRIFPGLIAVTLLAMFVLGPLVTTLSPGEYFSNARLYAYLSGLTLFGSYDLPGVFSSNPVPDVVNGSLWTLRYELICYVCLALSGAAGLLRRGWFVLLVTLVLIPLGWWARGRQLYFFAPLGLELADALRMSAYFAAGSAAYVFRNVIVLDRRMAIAAGLVSLILLRVGCFHLFFPVLGAYLVAYLGMQPRLGFPILLANDYCYGAYIYAFPIQQLVFMFGPDQPWWFNAIVSLPLTLLCAYLSWHVIEKPAMSLARETRSRNLIETRPSTI
jgi:peptidoglycan/LPS O-acetylase OafA/YrhL